MEELSGGTLSGNQTLQDLAELSKLLSATTEGDTYASVLKLVTHMFNAEGAVLWLLNDKKNALHRSATFHTDAARSKAFEQEAGEASLKFGNGLAGLSWAEGKTKVMQLPGMFSQSPHASASSSAPVCSVAFPLIAAGNSIGVLEMVNCADPVCAGEKQSLIDMLSTFLGNCIFGSHALKRLQENGSDTAQLQSKIKALEENSRELKTRLSKEHDQAVQNARYHAEFLSRVSRAIRTPLSGITSVIELMERNELPEDLQEFTSLIKESASGVLDVVEKVVEFSKQEAEMFAPLADDSNGDASINATGHQSSGAGKMSLATAHPLSGLDKVRVLVVNGLIGSAEFIEAYATASGIKCDSTSRGQSALTAMKQAVFVDRPYDVVFIERLLPDMDAFEFARVLQQEAQLAHTKLVLVSTFDSAARDDHALRSGFVEHIAKPVKQQQVISTLAAVMQGIPRVIAEQAPSVTEQITPAAARGQRMILVAEDNPVNQKVALLQLRELGFFATVVGNGQEAIDVLRQAEFDAVLMDCQMPEMDGFEATKRIRQWEKEVGRHVPIIAMTASALSSDRDKCLAVGMDDYLAKPVTYDKLDSVLFKWVESKEAQALAGELKMQQPGSESQQFGAPGADPVDVKGLNELLGEEETGEVLQLFVNSSEELISQIKDATDRRDGKLLKEAAHQLKGAAASVGANSIARSCLELEQCAKRDEWDAVPNVHDGLIQNFESAKSYIETKFS